MLRLFFAALFTAATALLAAAVVHAAAESAEDGASLSGEKAAEPVPKLATQRKDFLKAESMIKSRRFTQFRQLRPALNGYPLAPYLDYQILDARLSRITGEQAERFIEQVYDTPLALRFKDRYLRSQGKLRRWDNVLAASPTRPNDVELQCYFYRAQNQIGDRDLAWAGARELWLYGKSRPKACDPLFNEWIKAGQLDDDTSWQRQLLAFDAFRRGLMTYAAGKGSAALEPWSEKLLSAYLRPDRVQKLKLPVGEAKSRDVNTHALKRLARRDAKLALKIWQTERQRYAFEPEQAEAIQDAIAWRALFQSPETMQPWLDEYLIARGDTKRLEKRLRLAITESDWPAIEQLVQGLPALEQTSPEWQFWAGYAAQERGDTQTATQLWSQIAGEREYYGFLAAELSGTAYQLNHVPVQVPENTDALLELPGFARVNELMHFDRERDARSEWAKLLEGLPPEQKTALGQIAVTRGWHRFAIDAANAAKAWNALELRFPRAFEPTFIAAGKRHAVPETELMSIARRESAFFPGAVSGAGARGLMQILPSTARLIDPKLRGRNVSTHLFDVDNNVNLGGTYYRQLLDDHDNNRLLTLAAYNAGPHRVRRWLSKDGEGLSAAQWVVSIPFKETREYVQAVLAYNVVYRAMANEPVSLFKDNERKQRY